MFISCSIKAATFTRITNNLVKKSQQFYLNKQAWKSYCGTYCGTETTEEMELSKVVKRLHKIASPTLAGDWDNVGLLVEPSPPHVVTSILLTNDLTPPVLEEAIQKKCNMIISYHPPIFAPLKRLTQNKWKEQLIVKCIENRIAVHSPHTSHDCVQGGVNDWLIGCFDTKEVLPVEVHEKLPTNFSHRLTFDLPSEHTSCVLDSFKVIPEVNVAECIDRPNGTSNIHIQCVTPSLKKVMAVLQDKGSIVKNLETLQLSKAPKPGYGMGRRATLNEPIPLDKAVQIVKQHLKLDNVRLATAPGAPYVLSVAVCAGSGSSVLRNVPVDLYITGEMSHHEVLHAMYNGTSVILCEHTNTERGYLKLIQKQLQDGLKAGTHIEVSEVDTDPLKIV